MFLDDRSGLLKDDLGSYMNRNDPIHLGSSGFRVLTGLVRERVRGNRVDGRTYASVSGAGERDSWAVRSSVTSGVRRSGFINMMREPEPPTTRQPYPASLSPQSPLP